MASTPARNRVVRCGGRGRFSRKDEYLVFGLRFDLFEAGIVLPDPLFNGVDLRRIHRGCSSFFRLLFEFPMPPMAIKGVIDCLCFDRTNATATHGIVEHPIHLLPRSGLLLVS